MEFTHDQEILDRPRRHLVPLGFVNWATTEISGVALFWWAVWGVLQGIVIGAAQGAIMKEKDKV